MSEPRWQRDSPEEDAEAHRARELDKLGRWVQEQRVRPLTDALEFREIERGNPDGECWPGSPILPEWWDGITEPAHACPWCQRPVPAVPCAECRAGRAAAGDPAALWVWWASLTAEQRRRNIAARFGRDPWSDRPATAEIEWTDVTGDGQVRTLRHRYVGCTPDGIYWQARQRG